MPNLILPCYVLHIYMLRCCRKHILRRLDAPHIEHHLLVTDVDIYKLPIDYTRSEQRLSEQLHDELIGGSLHLRQLMLRMV
jgi:hypothetical protein